MEVNIFDYIEEVKYEKIKSEIRTNETIKIYSDNNIDIHLKKIGRKVYTFINTFGDKSLNEALNNVCSLV